jgi:hypothetical protein
MIRLSPGHHLIGLVQTKKVVHITDLLTDQTPQIFLENGGGEQKAG